MALEAVVSDLMARRSPGCNLIDIHLLRGGGGDVGDVGDDCGGECGSVRVDIDRHALVKVLREARTCGELRGFPTTLHKLQRTHVADLTMVRRLDFPTTSLRVERSTFLAFAPPFELPLPSRSSVFWTEWDSRRVPDAEFPCTMQTDDTCHCVVRTIRVGRRATLNFETHLTPVGRAIYRAWVSARPSDDPSDEVVRDLCMALRAIRAV